MNPGAHKQLEGEQLRRFERKIAPYSTTGCWIWVGGYDKDGYGNFFMPSGTTRAHRLSYQHFVGPISPGLEIDHLCRVRCCVNPSHLEVVTHAENMRRFSNAGTRIKTVCIRGHLLTRDNLKFYPDGRRACKKCRYIHKKKSRARKRLKYLEQVVAGR